MDIRINKGFSITISIIWILVSLFSLFLVYGFFYWIHPMDVSSIKWNWLILLNFGFIIEGLTSLVIGIWLYLNANKFNQDKWTWMLLGLTYGKYSLILLMILIISQNINTRINLLKSIHKLFLLFVISYSLNLASKYLINPNLTQILDVKNSMYISHYTQIIDLIPKIMMLIINIILAVKLKSWIGEFRLKFKLLWIVAILISGLFPIILYNGLTIIKGEKINAA